MTEDLFIKSKHVPVSVAINDNLTFEPVFIAERHPEILIMKFVENVAKKENSYMFLSTPKFKFLDIKNYLAPGLSYDAWCRAYGCKLQKLSFPYEWFDSFQKIYHNGPVKKEEFFSSLKGGISQEQYQNFCEEFRKRGCETMKDWLGEYNLADVEPFIEALEKTRE